MTIRHLLVVLLLAFPPHLGCSREVEAPAPSARPENEIVVLLHGMARTSHSMWRIESVLESRGYEVFNLGYPSTDKGIDELSELLGEKLAGCCADPDKKVHFVTHSMGGIIVRYHLAERDLPNLGRVVMLSPPSAGSEIVDLLQDNRLFQLTMGPAGQELGTEPSSLPRSLGPVEFELGVIAGNSSINPIFSELIPGVDDGTVSVESTKTPGMTDFLVLPYSHTFIMFSSEVIDQVLHFLARGVFDHDQKVS